ncbi:hypothetical protein K788_0003921 [Paraburkholderia caribensis MBA4]|uniref:Uncharacterized protein n=1 Tax=Paraburkholderia caribensis MBA4 TaxID=1323664 RepID=A0A0P0RAW8_9BURK|nr:hypothetical protein K788_0003921 [Paraburkholderia caribensis MBA4]
MARLLNASELFWTVQPGARCATGCDDGFRWNGPRVVATDEAQPLIESKRHS